MNRFARNQASHFKKKKHIDYGGERCALNVQLVLLLRRFQFIVLIIQDVFQYVLQVLRDTLLHAHPML